jgi:hypothetical protein
MVCRCEIVHSLCITQKRVGGQFGGRGSCLLSRRYPVVAFTCSCDLFLWKLLKRVVRGYAIAIKIVKSHHGAVFRKSKCHRLCDLCFRLEFGATCEFGLQAFFVS